MPHLSWLGEISKCKNIFFRFINLMVMQCCEKMRERMRTSYTARERLWTMQCEQRLSSVPGYSRWYKIVHTYAGNFVKKGSGMMQGCKDAFLLTVLRRLNRKGPLAWRWNWILIRRKWLPSNLVSMKSSVLCLHLWWERLQPPKVSILHSQPLVS